MQLLREATVQPGRAVIVVTHDSRVYEFGERIVEKSGERAAKRALCARPRLPTAKRRRSARGPEGGSVG